MHGVIELPFTDNTSFAFCTLHQEVTIIAMSVIPEDTFFLLLTPEQLSLQLINPQD